MKPKYEADTLRQKQFQESINDQNLRLNYLAEREKLLADALRKLPADKLIRFIQNFKDYQTPPRANHWTLYYINIDNFGDFPFLVYIPKDYQPSKAKPLFIYLHGAVRGGTEFAVKSNPPDFEGDVLGKLTKLDTFIIYPFARKDFNWLLHRQAFEAISRQIQFVKTLYKGYSRDT